MVQGSETTGPESDVPDTSTDCLSPAERVVSAFYLFLLRPRAGLGTASQLRNLVQSQRWDRPAFVACQQRKLSALLSGPCLHTEHYRPCALLAERAGPGLSEKLAALPILNKEDIRRSPRSLRTHPELPLSGQRFLTGGTTGDPIEIWRDRRSTSISEAAYWRGLMWLGLRPWTRGVQLAGFGRGTWYGRLRMRMVRKWFLEASLDRESLRAAVPALISRVRPQFIEGLVYEVVRLGETCDLSASGIRRIITTGEMLYGHQRDQIHSFYGAPVSEYYGSNEVNSIAYECECGSKHITDEHVIVETVDENGRSVREEPGRILVTDLDNALMPLIRYELGDLGILTDEPCPCGRRLTVLKQLLGRAQDALTNATGESVTATYLAARFKDLRRIRRFQLVQQGPVSIDLCYERAQVGAEEDAAEILREVRSRLGDEMRIDVREVDQITTTRAGKCLLVVGLKQRPSSQ